MALLPALAAAKAVAIPALMAAGKAAALGAVSGGAGYGIKKLLRGKR